MTHRPQDPRIAAQIDATLKRAFRDKAQEDLPDRFKKLLDQLRAREGK